MIVIFFSDPLNPRQPDDAYGEEADAAAEAGAGYGLVSYETLVYEGDAHRAVRHVEEQSQEQLGVLRGWMLAPDPYSRLYDVLLARGVRLINDPAAYRHCHYFPESYGVIQGRTPRSVWLIVELGGGQVAALPDHVDVSSFYTSLVAATEPGRAIAPGT